jgi:thymidylate kinase
MTTVALVGLDGAGKTTLARRLERSLPIPTRYVYMGLNREASTHLMPTTRLVRTLRRARARAGRPAPGASGSTSGSAGGSVVSTNGGGATQVAPRRGRLGTAVRLVNRLAEEWFLQMVVWFHEARGRVVIIDRHFLSDFYGTDVLAQDRTLGRRLHGLALERLYPKPDLMVFLDAPAEVLFSRKGEGTIESLTDRREDYLRLREVVPQFAVVDADRPVDDVEGDVARLILGLRKRRSPRPLEP